MSMVKYSPTALNFGYDFVLVVHFLGHPLHVSFLTGCSCANLSQGQVNEVAAKTLNKYEESKFWRTSPLTTQIVTRH